MSWKCISGVGQPWMILRVGILRFLQRVRRPKRKVPGSRGDGLLQILTALP
jgi:hypothetical protein